MVEEHQANPVEEQLAETNQGDVVITAERHIPAPETSNTLSKITAKDESPHREGRKYDSHFQALENLDVTSLHQQYLIQTSANREAESALVALLKKKYEVNICLYH